MRNYMERFVVLPFSLRCASHSSVELGESKESKEYSKDSIVSSISLFLYSSIFLFLGVWSSKCVNLNCCYYYFCKEDKKDK